MTARHKLLLYCVCLQYIRLFYATNFSAVKTEGLSHQPSPISTLPKPHYPSKSTITLASPRKRGGGTADKILWLAVQYSDSPAFTILKLFRAVTVGIVNALEAFMIALLSISISYAPSSLSKTALSLALHYHTCLPCQREVD